MRVFMYVMYVVAVSLIDRVERRLDRIGRRGVGRVRRLSLPDTNQDSAVPPAGAVAAEDERNESLLAADVLAGRLSKAQYQQEMAELATRADARHPLVVPSQPTR